MATNDQIVTSFNETVAAIGTDIANLRAGGGGGGAIPPFPISYTTGLQAALDSKQPLDIGLTALAGLSSPGLYYLSAADVWSPVTIGANLTFSGGTLSATGGGGGVSPPFAISDTTGLQTALDGKQPLDSDLTAIAALTTTTYGRGLLTLANVAALKTSLSLAKADVGLGNVDNTSDANKPVSTAQQAALDLKANLASPSFTGTPTVPTATAGTNTTQAASTAFVTAAVAAGGGGGSAPVLHPGYVSGRYYSPIKATPSANVTVEANRLYAVPFIIDRSVSISGFSLGVESGAAGNCLIGVYSATNGLPDTLLYQIPTPISTATSGFKNQALSSAQAATAGAYFLVTLFDAAPSIKGFSTAEGIMTNLLGHPSAFNVFNPGSLTSGYQSAANVAYSSGLPSTFGAVSLRTGGATPSPAMMVS